MFSWLGPTPQAFRVAPPTWGARPTKRVVTWAELRTDGEEYVKDLGPPPADSEDRKYMSWSLFFTTTDHVRFRSAKLGLNVDRVVELPARPNHGNSPAHTSCPTTEHGNAAATGRRKAILVDESSFPANWLSHPCNSSPWHPNLSSPTARVQTPDVVRDSRIPSER